MRDSEGIARERVEVARIDNLISSTASAQLERVLSPYADGMETRLSVVDMTCTSAIPNYNRSWSVHVQYQTARKLPGSLIEANQVCYFTYGWYGFRPRRPRRLGPRPGLVFIVITHPTTQTARRHDVRHDGQHSTMYITDG